MAQPVTFIVEELPRVVRAGAAVERFEWTAEGYSSPVKPFHTPLSIRYKRSDYGGATRPSFQVLGPKLDTMTFEGEWNDKHNTTGFAVAERKRFRAMVARSNPVRITWGDVVFTGIIVACDCPVLDDYRVRYSFTLEPERDDQLEDAGISRGQDTLLNGRQLSEQARVEADALAAAAGTAPVSAMAGDINAQQVTANAEVQAAMDEVDQTVDQRLLAGVEEPTALQRVATAFRRAKIGCITFLDNLVELRSDTDMTIRSVTGELAFDEWRISSAYYARRTFYACSFGERSCKERAAPRAQMTYRPRKGESMYDVSKAVYGTPHHWRAIAERNNLDGPNLNGDEVLVIPELQTGT